MKRFYAKLIFGSVLLAAPIQGISCLGTPVGGAPIYNAGGIVTAIRAFLANFGITV